MRRASGNPDLAFGFKKGKSIKDNAKRHKCRKWVMNFDLEDFFPSFNFGRVRGFFIADKRFSLNETVATMIAQIACDGNSLPQGSPCSPIIAELIANILDVRLLNFAKKHKLTYTRYADDITFSTKKKDVSHHIATQIPCSPNKWKVGVELENVIIKAGFKINHNKTRINSNNIRQEVTGLVVNRKINISKSYRKSCRAMCNELYRSGKYFFYLTPKNRVSERTKVEESKCVSRIEGMLSHIYDIQKYQLLIRDDKKQAPSITDEFRKFLFYKYFVRNVLPLIVTEGKTDKIYLKCALRRLYVSYPTLIDVDQNGFDLKLYIRFFNLESKNSEIMKLGGGGVENICTILKQYYCYVGSDASYKKKIVHMPMRAPVIILLDSDSGVESVAKQAKKLFGVDFTWDSPEKFHHLYENLYVVLIPIQNMKQTCIEDLFDESVLNIELNEKKFNNNNRIDPQKEYGKEVLAKNVVHKNQNSINFDNFHALFERIVAVLDHYCNRNTRS